MIDKITYFFKEHCDIDDEDEVQKIAVARKWSRLCVKCNKKVATNYGMKKYTEEEHTELFVAKCLEIERK